MTQQGEGEWERVCNSDERARAEGREGNVSSSARVQRSRRGRDKQGPHHQGTVCWEPIQEGPPKGSGFRSVFLKAGPSSGLVRKRGKAGRTGGRSPVRGRCKMAGEH